MHREEECASCINSIDFQGENGTWGECKDDSGCNLLLERKSYDFQGEEHPLDTTLCKLHIQSIDLHGLQTDDSVSVPWPVENAHVHGHFVLQRKQKMVLKFKKAMMEVNPLISTAAGFRHCWKPGKKWRNWKPRKTRWRWSRQVNQYMESKSFKFFPDPFDKEFQWKGRGEPTSSSSTITWS